MKYEKDENDSLRNLVIQLNNELEREKNTIDSLEQLIQDLSLEKERLQYQLEQYVDEHDNANTTLVNNLERELERKDNHLNNLK